MRLRKRRMRRWIAVAVAATAVAAPAGQAGHYDRGTAGQKPVDFWNLAPDDRAVPRATPVAAPAPDLAPDDRVAPRPTPVTPTPTATSAPDLAPDDIAVPRPIPVSPPATGTVSDGTSWAPSPTETAVLAGAAKRASDPREPGVAAANADGFDWAAALVGGTFGVAFALLATGGMLLAHRRNRTPTTA